MKLRETIGAIIAPTSELAYGAEITPAAEAEAPAKA